MAAKRIEHSDAYELSPTAPIFWWFKNHDEPTQSNPDEIRMHIVKEDDGLDNYRPTPAPKPDSLANLKSDLLPQAVRSPVRTLQDIMSQRPYEGLQDNALNEPLSEPEATVEPESQSINFSFLQVVKNGLTRVTPNRRILGDALSRLGEKKESFKDRRRTVWGLGAAAVSGDKKPPIGAIKIVRDKTEAFYKINGPEFLQKHQRKIIIGSVALTGALMAFGAGEAYVTHDFGLAAIHDGLNHVHETAKHALHHGVGQNPIGTHTEHQPVLGDSAHTPAISHANPNHVGSVDNTTSAGHAQEISKNKHPLKLWVHIGLGDGPTQAIKKLFPGHSPEEYLKVFKETIKLRGQNIFRGIPHYSEGHGLFGFSHEGTIRLSRETYQTLGYLFKRSG